MTSSVSGRFISTPLPSQSRQAPPAMTKNLQVDYDLKEYTEEVKPGSPLPNEHSRDGKVNGNYDHFQTVAIQQENANKTDQSMMENPLMKDVEISNPLNATSLRNYTLALIERLRPLAEDDKEAILECQKANLFAKENAACLKNCLINLIENTDQQTEGAEVNGAFNKLIRFGMPEKLVMPVVGETNDLVPQGNCCFVDLAQSPRVDVAIYHPEHATAMVTWDTKTRKVVFPEDFNGVIPKVRATHQNLQYYGCCFACQSIKQVQMLFPSEIHTCTYGPKYLSNYCMAEENDGGACLERHTFAHLDSPLSSNSGVMILGKFTDDTETQMHLTAFYVPRGQIVYIPGNVLHTNNYFHGKWIMLVSDVPDKELLRLHKADKLKTKFKFTFTELKME